MNTEHKEIWGDGFVHSLDSSNGFATYTHIKMYENLHSMLNILYFKSCFNKIFKKHGICHNKPVKKKNLQWEVIGGEVPKIKNLTNNTKCPRRHSI